MKAAEALIGWTPPFYEDSDTVGQVEIRAQTDDGENGWLREYACFGGAVSDKWRELEGCPAIAMVFIKFSTLVTRDGIAPLVAHEAFLKIDEYAERIAPDTPGHRTGRDHLRLVKR